MISVEKTLSQLTINNLKIIKRNSSQMVLEHGRNGGRGEVKDLGGVLKAWSDDGQLGMVKN